MAQQPTDEDYRTALDHMTDAIVDYIRSEAETTHEADDLLSDLIFEEADEHVAYDHDAALTVLESSPNEPDEWEPFAEGKSDWKEVVQAMAFTVVRQDLYDALEREEYLDEYWNPTDKLVAPEADA